MIELIGVSAANQILGLDIGLSTQKMDEYLKKHGVKALGKDSMGFKWDKDQINSLAKKLSEDKKSAIVPMTNLQPPTAKALTDYGIQLSKISGEVAHISQSSRLEHQDALDRLETIIKQGQYIGGMLSELTRMGSKQTSSQNGSDAAGELAGFVGSYLEDMKSSISVEMIDIKASLTRQMDSALSSIDDKLEMMQKAIAGHTRLAGDLKQGIADIHKMAQNTTTNHNQTSKRLSEDITKGLARVEQAIDQMSK